MGAIIHGGAFVLVCWALWSEWFGREMPIVFPVVGILALVFFAVRFLRHLLGRRLKYRFGLRSLLLFVAVASVFFSWFAVRMRKAEKQQAAVAELRERGASVQYDWEDALLRKVPRDQLGFPTGTIEWEPPLPLWLWNLLGEDFCATVIHVTFDEDTVDEDLVYLEDLPDLTWLCLWVCPNVTDGGLKHLERLHHLEYLNLGETKVTDKGLVHLTELKNLDFLIFDFTRVTDEGIEELRKSLPNTFIRN